MEKSVDEMTLEEKRQKVKNWPERAIPMAICEVFGFKPGLPQFDGVIITEAPDELKGESGR